MSLMYQRYERPKDGTTLLLGFNQPWKDPRKPENQPLPLLESEKGIHLPTWGTIAGACVVLSLLSVFKHRRMTKYW